MWKNQTSKMNLNALWNVVKDYCPNFNSLTWPKQYRETCHIWEWIAIMQCFVSDVMWTTIQFSSVGFILSKLRFLVGNAKGLTWNLNRYVCMGNGVIMGVRFWKVLNKMVSHCWIHFESIKWKYVQIYEKMGFKLSTWQLWKHFINT